MPVAKYKLMQSISTFSILIIQIQCKTPPDRKHNVDLNICIEQGWSKRKEFFLGIPDTFVELLV